MLRKKEFIAIELSVLKRVSDIMKRTTLFKKHIMADDILVLPVVHDALCARIAEEVGFNAICAAGYANSATMLGQPDVSLLTLTEMVDC